MEEQQINLCLTQWQQHHNQNAVTELYNGLSQFFHYLQGKPYCKKLDGESLLNEAFYDAINKCDLTKASFKTLLERIFRYKCANHRRRFIGLYTHRRDFISVDPTIGIEKKKFNLNNVPADLTADIRRQDLLEAINQLSEKESSILRQFIEGKSRKEIRKDLGMSKSNMHYWMDKAECSLRKVFIS